MSVDMRASDEDRHRVIAALQRHTAAGRLSLDEFSDRVSEVYAARTLGDLTLVTRDLPAEAATGESTVDRNVGQLLIVFAVAAATLVLLGLYMALTR